MGANDGSEHHLCAERGVGGCGFDIGVQSHGNGGEDKRILEDVEAVEGDDVIIEGGEFGEVG